MSEESADPSDPAPPEDLEYVGPDIAIPEDIPDVPAPPPAPAVESVGSEVAPIRAELIELDLAEVGIVMDSDAVERSATTVNEVVSLTRIPEAITDRLAPVPGPSELPIAMKSDRAEVAADESPQQITERSTTTTTTDRSTSVPTDSGDAGVSSTLPEATDQQEIEIQGAAPEPSELPSTAPTIATPPDGSEPEPPTDEEPGAEPVQPTESPTDESSATTIPGTTTTSLPTTTIPGTTTTSLPAEPAPATTLPVGSPAAPVATSVPTTVPPPVEGGDPVTPSSTTTEAATTVPPATATVTEPAIDLVDDVVPAVVRVDIQSDEAAIRAGLDRVAFFLEFESRAYLAVDSREKFRVQIDYSQMAEWAGGDWAGRVELVTFDRCWFGSASERKAPVSACKGPRVVPGAVNDRVRGVVYADLTLSEIEQLSAVGGGPRAASTNGGPGFGLSGSAYSDLGNFGTSDLTVGSRWEVGLNGGSFNWSFDLPVPTPPAGPVPDVSFNYSTGSIDGLSSDENTQGGVLGVGWSMGTDAFIERRYKSCEQDGQPGDGELCYSGDHTVMSMAGHSGILINWDTTTYGSWEINHYRLQQDSGLRVMRYRKTSGTGYGDFGVDNDREFWHAIDTDGTEYWFGYGRANGGFANTNGVITSPDPMGAITSNPSDVDDTLNSVWTVPVQANSNEPCGNLSGDWCHQAYRWQLDRVVDASDRAMVYLYELQMNRYAQNGSSNGYTPYVSGGTLKRINYGVLASYANRENVATSSVHFTYINRCSQPSTNCPTPPNPSNGSIYPDLPNDMVCMSGPPCAAQSPTFFQQKVLTHVYTDVRSNSGTTRFSGVRTVFDWVRPNATYENVRPFLRSLQRYAHSTSYTFPKITFGSRCPGSVPATGFYQDPDCGVRPNRVNNYLNGAAGVPAMLHWRINTILDERGTDIRMRYSVPDSSCPGASSGWNVNRKRCYPRWYAAPNPQYGAGFVAFNKYVVERVQQVDPRSPNPQNPSILEETSYEYFQPTGSDIHSGMGWRADDDPFTPLSRRTWGKFRGYSAVVVYEGAPSEPGRTRTTHRFWRGMHLNSSSHGSGNVPQNHQHYIPAGFNQPDWDSYAGMTRAVTRQDEDNPSVIFSRVTTLPTSVSVSGLDIYNRQARRVQPAKVYTEEGSRYSLVEYQYDGQGKRTKMLEFGETSATFGNTNGPTTDWDSNGAPDDRCTTYSYASNANALFPEGLLKEIQMTDSAACNGTELSRTKIYYDGLAFNSAPTRGQVTRERTYVGDSSTVSPATAYLDRDMTYENGGWRRLHTETDARGNTTTHGYTSWAGSTSLGASANHNLRISSTYTPLGFVAETILDIYGNPVQIEDPNNRTTKICYDVFNRLSKVFFNDNSYGGASQSTLCSGPYTPSRELSYVVTTHPYTKAAYTIGTYVDQVHSWKTRIIDLYAKSSDGYVSSSNDSRITTWSFLDGLGRTTETQTHAATGGGTVVTRMLYDTVGRVRRSSEPHHVNSGMGTARLTNDSSGLEREIETSYDTLSRPVLERHLSFGTELRRRTNSYPALYETRTSDWYSGSNSFGDTSTLVDVYGNVVSTTEHRPGSSDYQTERRYNLRGDLVGVKDHGGSITTYEPNHLGWVTEVDDPNAGLRTTTYFRTGEIYRTVDAEGNQVTRNIDARGRLVVAAHGSSASSFDDRVVDIDYDPSGNLGAVDEVTSYQRRNNDPNLETDAVHVARSTGFDSMGRITSWTLRAPGTDYSSFTGDEALNDTYSFSQSYTRTGQPYQTTFPAMAGLPSETVTRSYNPLGLLLDAESPAAPGGDYIASHVYDWYGRPEQVTLGNGSHSLRIGRSYRTNDGRVSNMNAWLTSPNGNSYVQYDSYNYDDPGNPTDIIRNLAGSSFDERECFYYDSRQRLGSAHTISYGTPSCPSSPQSSPSGSSPSPYAKSYTYDSQHRMTANTGRNYSYNELVSGCVSGTNSLKEHAPSFITGVAGVNYSFDLEYDCNGSMIESTTAGVTTEHTWSGLNRLVETKVGSANASVNTYTYAGQRVMRRDPNYQRTIDFGSVQLRWRPTSGSAGTLEVSRQYPGGSIRDFDGSLKFTARNHQGSVVAAVDASSGAIQRNYYDPYGELRAGAPTADRAFLGEVRDEAANLTYLNNRHYDPTTGVFVSVDPLVSKTMEPYIYGAANPITISDPTGLCGCEFFGDLSDYAQPYSDASDQNNVTKYWADYWSRPSAASTSSGSASFNPIRGAGSVQVNLFIPMEQVFWMGIGVEGDGRGFSSAAGIADSRATITLNLEAGLGIAEFNYSCTSGGNCEDAYPTSFLVNDAAAAVFGSGSPNGVVLIEGDGGFSLIITGKVSVGLPFAPSINGRLDFTVDGGGVLSVQRSGNEFPAYEAYQTANGRTRPVLRSPARTHGYLIDGPAGHIFRAVATCDYNPFC